MAALLLKPHQYQTTRPALKIHNPVISNQDTVDLDNSQTLFTDVHNPSMQPHHHIDTYTLSFNQAWSHLQHFVVAYISFCIGSILPVSKLKSRHMKTKETAPTIMQSRNSSEVIGSEGVESIYYVIRCGWFEKQIDEAKSMLRVLFLV